jgi:hypothetical protein
MACRSGVGGQAPRLGVSCHQGAPVQEGACSGMRPLRMELLPTHGAANRSVRGGSSVSATCRIWTDAVGFRRLRRRTGAPVRPAVLTSGLVAISARGRGGASHLPVLGGVHWESAHHRVARGSAQLSDQVSRRCKSSVCANSGRLAQADQHLPAALGVSELFVIEIWLLAATDRG